MWYIRMCILPLLGTVFYKCKPHLVGGIAHVLHILTDVLWAPPNVLCLRETGVIPKPVWALEIIFSNPSRWFYSSFSYFIHTHTLSTTQLKTWGLCKFPLQRISFCSPCYFRTLAALAFVNSPFYSSVQRTTVLSLETFSDSKLSKLFSFPRHHCLVAWWSVSWKLWYFLYHIFCYYIYLLRVAHALFFK